MTTFEALVSISQTVLRQRGEWHGPATTHADIEWAVNQIHDLLPAANGALCAMAVNELKRRAGHGGTIP